MTLEMWVILAYRVAGSLPVLRWPLFGGILALVVDSFDIVLRAYLDLGGVRDYHSFDKWADQVYLALFLVVALRWEGPARTIAVALYLFRMVGFIAFEVTGERWVLMLFPNVFEFWFLFVAFTQRYWRGFRWERRPIALALAVATAAKLVHEYVVHVGRWLDGFTPHDVVEWVLRLFGG
jgi:glucose-6-phosphate-specific signal transduction histidine kinase